MKKSKQTTAGGDAPPAGDVDEAKALARELVADPQRFVKVMLTFIEHPDFIAGRIVNAASYSEAREIVKGLRQIAVKVDITIEKGSTQ